MDKFETIMAIIPKEQDPQYFRAVAYMYAGGASIEEIAVIQGIPADEVKNIVNLDRVQTTIKEVQAKMFSKKGIEIFKAWVPDAALVTHEIMIDKSQKGTTRLTAASMVLDRAAGKAIQPHEVESPTLRKVIEMLDAQAKAQMPATIETEAKAVDTVEEAQVVEDPLDNYLEENLK